MHDVSPVASQDEPQPAPSLRRLLPLLLLFVCRLDNDFLSLLKCHLMLVLALSVLFSSAVLILELVLVLLHMLVLLFVASAALVVFVAVVVSPPFPFFYATRLFKFKLQLPALPETPPEIVASLD